MPRHTILVIVFGTALCINEHNVCSLFAIECTWIICACSSKVFYSFIYFIFVLVSP